MVAFSGMGAGPPKARLRRKGSDADDRDMPGLRIIDRHTRTVSHDPATMALTASMTAKPATAAGREWWVIVGSSRMEASWWGCGAPVSAATTTPSMSLAVSPASRMAATEASTAREADD